MTTVKTRMGAGLGAVALAAGLSLIAPGTASAASSCQGSSYSGTCVEASNVVQSIKVLDTVPMINDTPYVGTFTCNFEKSVSASLSATATVSAEVQAGIPGAVQATTGVSASLSVSATASQSSSVAGSFELQPGQSVNCEQIAVVQTASIRSYDYSPTGTTNERTFTAEVPSSIGARAT